MSTKVEITKFEEIYRFYNNMISHISKRILNDTEKIEDCKQKSYETILRNLDKIDEINSLSTKRYIYKITYTSALHIIRENKRYISNGFTGETIADESENIEHMVLFHETLEELKRGFQSLNNETKQLLVYRIKQHMPYRQISLIFNLSEVTCRKKMQRAREQLME